jgi:hypothetical protein
MKKWMDMLAEGAVAFAVGTVVLALFRSGTRVIAAEAWSAPRLLEDNGWNSRVPNAWIDFPPDEAMPSRAFH